MELNEYQRLANLTDKRPATEADDQMALVFPLMGIASEVGSLITQYKKHVRDGDAHPLFSQRIKEELGDVLWYVANLAGKLDLKLDDIAGLNLERIAERWPMEGEDHPARLLDEHFPPAEQLPRRLTVVFEEIDIEGRQKLVMTRNGEQLGDPLVDMNRDPDGYRFHDAFHLTYAALLGWSPLLRDLLGLKRDSDPEVREVDDAGRALFIEEGLSAFIFNYAKEHNFFEGTDHIDSEILRTITGMVSHLEVRVRTINEWQEAILRSFEIWRALMKNGGGTVHLDLPARRIDFESPED
ncbi:MAG: nucleoside triphosphate pyrophosphohydrolase family protein [Actinomycetota bacterium]|nr:nucleoside triphosphate pyrophosphohydrolase family protein [Actinomycetota bacterium]